MDEIAKRLEREVARRRRDERKTARTNEENRSLRKKLRELDWEYRALKTAVEADAYHARKLRVAQDRLALIRDIVATPIDDWLSLGKEDVS